MTGRRPGKFKNISREISKNLIFEISNHDDGILHSGGTTTTSIGPMGSGKTTFALWHALKCQHAADSLSNTDTQKLKPETIIWRGRQFDYWSTLLNSHIEDALNITHGRPVVIHTHQDDDLTFTMQDRGDTIELMPDGKELIFKKHSNIPSLYRNLVPRAFNIVYEPTVYYLTPERVQALYQKLYADVKHPKGYNPKRKKPEAIVRPVRAPPPVWWFEFAEEYLGLKNQNEFVTLIIDESHQVFPASVSSVHWHLCEMFANSVIDFRRRNVSLFAISHQPQLLDYRIFDRSQYFIWLSGSRPPARSTIIRNRRLTSLLGKGEYFIEEANRQFGFGKFSKLPQAPVIEVEGMVPDESRITPPPMPRTKDEYEYEEQNLVIS